MSKATKKKRTSTKLAVRQVVETNFELSLARTDVHSLALVSRRMIEPGGFAYPIIEALNAINYRVPSDRILVLPALPKDMIGRIVVPGIAKEQLNTGLVLRVGRDCMEVEPGQIADYGKHAGQPTEIAGFKLLRLRECELTGMAG